MWVSLFLFSPGVARIDGDTIVGHGRPFGVFVALRHTAEVEREAGGFGRYLRSQKNSPYYFNPYGGQQRSFIEEFEKQVREKLVDRFEIKSLTFLDERVQSRGCGRPWRETPLAYLLLAAKDGSVDQIPALYMDLDFVDSRGPVVLPVESQITLIDARPESVAPRPVAGLEVTQILDDREIAAGRITLEVKATGRGLVPELSAFSRTGFDGQRVEEIKDQGLAVTAVDSAADDVTPVSKRNWLLRLTAEGAPASREFHFLEPVRGGTKMTYKRYANADIVEVQPKLALSGLSLHPRPLWHWLVPATVLVALSGGVGWWVRRRRPESATQTSRYQGPEAATPFSVIGLLRRMQADASLGRSAADRIDLDETIQRLESRFFDRNGDDPEPDLAGITRRRVAMTVRARRLA